MSDYIAWLDAPKGTGADRIGGKGASLARLGGAGFPVPPGFAVTVEAYRAFHDDHGLDNTLTALLAISGRPTAAEVREACAPIAERLAGAQLPERVRASINDAFDHLDAKTPAATTYAVRSSGVSEDGAAASFAGLYETYLNLSTSDEVLDALHKCYHSLWEPRAAHYRAIKGVDHRKEAMGVVVMETVRSVASGVAFTLNPITGATDEILINSSWGLGEAVVSGIVTPDNYLVGKDGGLRQRDISHKEAQVVPVAGGTETQPVPPDRVNASSLSDEQVRQVAEMAAAVERYYGSPVDIEFAYDPHGRFFLLQARPVTTR